MTDETKETRSSADGGDGQEQSSPAMQQIVDMGSSVVKNRHGTVHCLTIVGQVEGHMVLPNNTKSTKYEHVLPLLASLEESDDVDGLLLLLNTVGGDIEAGLAIAELVAGMRLPTVTLVLGGGHSIGVPLAVCGKEAVKRGVKAGDIIKQVSAIAGGSGGGKPDSAMGGGKDVLMLDNALAMVDNVVSMKLGL